MGRKRKIDASAKIAVTQKQIKKEVLHDDDAGNDSQKEEQKVFAGEDSKTNKNTWIDKCQQWVAEQREQVAEPPPPEPDVDDETPMDEPAELPPGAAEPLRKALKHYNEKEILNSVMYECEWLKCGFETTEDIAYVAHVEAHAFQYLEKQQEEDEDLVCFWDVCDFRTSSRSELESHVHFHAYHNRVKTYGASLSRIISIPRCNGDSRRRNCIDGFKTQFRCEWSDCGEHFIRVQPFFAHVNYHVHDQFPVDRKSTKKQLQCQWDGCTQVYLRRSLALDHVRRHSTERSIGCYTCGAIFGSRLKFMDHCRRQVEYHNREYRCPECDKLFATKQLMNDHKNIHNKKFKCPLCPMMWPSRKAMTYHIRYRHVDVKPFECHICGHRTVTKADLEEHVLTHDERRMFRCEEFGCEATYKCQRSLKKHVDSVHYGAGPGIYACHLCPIQYKAGATLSRHLIRAHRYKRPPGYNRFTYRANQHGILQLSSVTPGEGRESSVEHEYVIEEISSPPDADKPEVIKPDYSENNPSLPETFTSFAINELDSVNPNTISIKLQPAEELPKSVYQKRTCTATTAEVESAEQMNDSETTSDNTLPCLNMKIEVEEPQISSIVSKSIDDFTVMKRYLKVEKSVVISYEEMDSSGSVIRSETVQTTELNREKLLKGELP
ncbi:histone H4 transcription factor [Armigeres subalbatus]|uniref:histone H4 transcription factor n=1 Tax=Armigeres subalbatus TaxID=124917 RepID=UPI002ED0D60E